MFDDFHLVQTWQELFYTVTVDWWYEDIALSDCVDDTVCDVAEMWRRCDAGVDTHFVTRVRVFYRGHEMATETVGSCYAAGCDPDIEILENRLGGYFDDMLDAVRADADQVLVRLNRDLIRDVANLQAH